MSPSQRRLPWDRTNEGFNQLRTNERHSPQDYRMNLSNLTLRQPSSANLDPALPFQIPRKCHISHIIRAMIVSNPLLPSPLLPMSAIHDRANQQRCYFSLMACREKEIVVSRSNWTVGWKRDETDTR